jgi:filamentous hemagglutinin family protein
MPFLEAGGFHPINAHTLKLIQNPGFWTVSLASLAFLAVPQPTQAQITPDGSLGTQVNGACGGTGGVCAIQGGSQRGGNLFHSFQQFSLPNGDLAGFITTSAIQNVIVRVTGQGTDFISNINGTIQTSNPANFFLLNPNGIEFGSRARLFTSGSFLATTAERIQFQDGTVLSTSNPTPLLTISVPTGLQFGQSPGEIRSRLRIESGNNSLFTDFALVGGDVTLDNSIVIAPGRRVELAAVAGGETVNLKTNGNELGLDFLNEISRANVLLKNGSLIRTSSLEGGAVQIQGDRVTLANNANIVSYTSGSETGKDLLIRAANLTLIDSSAIEVITTGSGGGGNIQIETGILNILKGSAVTAGTLGLGRGGNVTVAADSINLAELDTNSSSSVLRSGSFGQLSGQAGDVIVLARLLSLRGGAAISTRTFGQGRGGNMVVTVREFAEMIGTDGQDNVSGLFSTTSGSGNSGNLSFNVGQLRIFDGAAVTASTFGQGAAGNVTVSADSIEVVGRSADHQFASGITSQANVGTTQKAGDVTVVTRLLSIRDGATVSTATIGQGRGGSLNVTADSIEIVGISDDRQFTSILSNESINADSGNTTVLTRLLSIRDGGAISSQTFGKGRGGNIKLTVRETAELSGSARLTDGETTVSSVFTTTSGLGDAGNLSFNVGQLRILDGAAVTASTFGQGAAGNVTVSADSIEVVGRSADRQFASGITSQANVGTTQKAGDVTVVTRLLSIRDGATVSTATIGQGAAGNLNVTVYESAELIGTVTNKDNETVSSGLSTATAGQGMAGNLQLMTNKLTMRDGAEISAFTLGEKDGGRIEVNAEEINILDNAEIRSLSEGPGNAGDIFITASKIALNNQGRVNSQSTSSDGGNIFISPSQILLLRNGSQISSSAGTSQAGGNGGNITINAPRGFIVGVKSENSDITANAFTGSGGRVNIVAQGIYGLQFRPNLTDFSDITASSTLGVSGTVTLNTPGLDPSRGLTELPENIIDTNRILATSCIVRQGSAGGTFFITGNGGLPQRPGTPAAPWFPTGTVQAIPDEQAGTPPHPDPIVEMDEIYHLPNGQVILGRACDH